MFPDVRKRVKKVGQPPGTAVYTGKKTTETQLTVVEYSPHDFHEITGKTLAECLTDQKENVITWVNVVGLSDVALIQELAERYHLHPLTVEDILNVEQRPKVEEFDGYEFLTLKILAWDPKKNTFTAEQFSIAFGKKFILTFQESPTTIFHTIYERLRSSSVQRLRQQGSDYLVYRLLDCAVDYYFVVLEAIGDLIETAEERIIASPNPQTMRVLYRLKRQMLSLRKIIWPMRELISHLLQTEEVAVTPFTRVYMRDLYDHIVQAIDTVETFRDMLSSMLDMYLSSLTNRMNEIMKTLTIIATIFIPITFVASLYGMNFVYMPELHWHWGYFTVLGVMGLVVVVMLIYFRRKKWI